MEPVDVMLEFWVVFAKLHRSGIVQWAGLKPKPYNKAALRRSCATC